MNNLNDMYPMHPQHDPLRIAHVIDYGQYQHGTCPHCGRCRHCGSPPVAPPPSVPTTGAQPIWIGPSTTSTAPVITRC